MSAPRVTDSVAENGVAGFAFPIATGRDLEAAIIELANGRRLEHILGKEDDSEEVIRQLAYLARLDFDGARRDMLKEDGERRKIPPGVAIQDLLRLEEPTERYLVGGDVAIQPDSNLLIVAAPKSYKTLTTLHMAVVAAGGRSALGAFPIAKPLRVGMVLMEDHAARTKRRVLRIAESEGIDPEELRGRLHFWFRPPLQLGDVQAVRDLGDYVEMLNLDLLFVDNYAYVATGDSNSADEVTPQLAALSSLRARRPGLTVGLVVHARKPVEGKGERVTDIIRGSGAFGAWFDTAIALHRADEHSPVTVRVEHRDLPSPDPFAFTVEDEIPGPPPSGYLRLRRSNRTAAEIARDKAAEKFVPQLKEQLARYPEGLSRRGLERLANDIPGASQRDVMAAFELLQRGGEATIDGASVKGLADSYRLTAAGVS